MKYSKSLTMLILTFILSGCLQNDTMSDITIHTTTYPIEFVTARLYGEHSTIESIFPNGAVQEELVGDKLLNDYSKTDLFIFDGLSDNEVDYVYKMSQFKKENSNQQLKIIDVSSSLVYEYSVEELWLHPMNLLTIANNIKKGFEEYISSAYLINDITENYNVLRQELFQLDADYRDMAERANRKTIVISDDRFMWLKSYGINVISLEENDRLTQKDIYDATELIKNKDVLYIFTVKGQEVNDTVKAIQTNTKVQLIELHDLYKLSEEEANRGETYFSIMKDNLESLKKQLYN